MTEDGTEKIDLENLVATENAKHLPEIVLYDDVQFRRLMIRTNLGYSALGGMKNKYSSMVIVSGVWQFFNDENFRGFLGELGPGYYPDLRHSLLNGHDNITSLKCVRRTD